ncbi:MAG: response regulator [Eubacteriales bacterium]|nr:response regulator [Eubacteriales bacterium]
MSLYRLMLVDDEPEIRDGLLEIIDWAKEGFEVVGVAENGLEALQVAENVTPDLVVTDIRMPFLDGLEMARRMRVMLPTVQFIVLSGYDEFEYARQAVQIQIKDYILKPISSEEFISVLRRVKKHLDEDFAQRNNVLALQKHFRASLPILRELLLTSLLSGGLSSQDAAQSAEQYELPLTSPRYAVALISFSGSETDDPDLLENPDLMRFAVINIVSEVLQSQAHCHVFHYNHLVAALLLLEKEEAQAFSSVVDLLEAARQTVKRYLGCALTIGVSNPCEQLGQLHHAAEQAQSALDQSVLLGESQVLAIADLEPGSTRSLAAEEAELRALSNAIKMGDVAGAEKKTYALLEEVRHNKASFQDYQVYLLEVLITIIRVARDLDIEWSGQEQQAEAASLDALLQCRELNEAEAALCTLCRRLARRVQDTRVESGRQLTNQAVEYIEKNYTSSDMSLENVCGHLHISAAYLSALFKRETKKTVHQYLTDLRMDKALSLLIGSDMKTADIALAVGLGEPSYFSYSFKKYFGVSPSQTRKNATEAKQP